MGFRDSGMGEMRVSFKTEKETQKQELRQYQSEVGKQQSQLSQVSSKQLKWKLWNSLPARTGLNPGFELSWS